MSTSSLTQQSRLIGHTRKGYRKGWGGKEEGEINDARLRKGKFGLRVITTEVTTLHHEQFVDGIVNGRVQALRQRRGVVR